MGAKNGLARNQHAFDRFSSAVEIPMLVITVLWLPVLLIPLIWAVHGTAADVLAGLDYAVWGLFGLEYLIKLYLAPERWTFVRTHIMDLVIVVFPFFRPARLSRITKFGRVGLAVERAANRGKSIVTHQGLHFVLPSIAVIIVASAGVVTVAERHARGSNIHNFGDGIWWAIVTAATVGYGDTSPVTPIGRGVAVFLMLAGIALIGVLTATVASYFVGQNAEAAQADRKDLHQELAEAKTERDELAAKLDHLSDQIDRLLASLPASSESTAGEGPRTRTRTGIRTRTRRR